MNLVCSVSILMGLQALAPADQKKLDAAKAAVEKSPDDAAANLALGKLLCFTAGDWAGGLPFLAKGGDRDFAPAAEKDLAPKTAPLDSVEAADLWLALEKKQPKLKIRLRERALSHFSDAWLRMDDGPVKVALRERVRVLQAKAQPANRVGAFPRGSFSHLSGADCGAGLDREYAMSGQFSVKVLPPPRAMKNPIYKSWIRSEEFACKPGEKVAFGCWLLTESTEETNDYFVVRFLDPRGALLQTLGPKIKSDLPVWTYYASEATVPDGAMRVDMGLYMSKETKGTAWIDDISVKIDGKEMIRNGSFESR